MAATAPVLLIDTAATLTWAVVEGTPTSASVVVFDHAGAQAETPTVTVSGTTLSAPILAATLDEASETYRARWTYTAGGTVYKRDQRFAVKKSIAAHALSSDRLVSDYYPILRSRYPSGVSTWQTLINAAFAELANLFRAKGLDIDSARDCSTLEPALAALAAYKIATSYSFGSDASSPMQQWAADRETEYVRKLEQAIASFPWYDADGDLVPNAGETDVGLGRLRLSR